MPQQTWFLTCELADNKIPCGGFNLLGGGIKGKDISLVRQLNGLAMGMQRQQYIHPLFLNENDYIKIVEGMEKSETEVAPPIDNIRLFETDYTDLISYEINFTDLEKQMKSGEIFLNSYQEIIHHFYNHFLPQYAGNNGKAMNMYDICNWYTLPLGFITTGTYTLDDQPLYVGVYRGINYILTSFYQTDNIFVAIEKSTGLINTIFSDFMNVEISLRPSYPDSDSIPTTPTLIFTPEGNRFYFANPNEGN